MVPALAAWAVRQHVVPSAKVSDTLTTSSGIFPYKGAANYASVNTSLWMKFYLGDSSDWDGNTLARVNVIAGHLECHRIQTQPEFWEKERKATTIH
jgi:hypothetical protein